MVGDRNSAESTQKKGNWRGAKTSRKVVRHRWQQAASRSVGTRSSRLRYGLRSALWLVTLLALAFAFMFFMRFRPRQTPVLAVVVTQYEKPLLPNSWAYEDLERLRLLDGDTILLFDADDTQTGKDGLIADFQRLINKATLALTSSEPVLVYLSMHADVNDDGAPCLIPSGASAFNAETWVPFDRLLDIADKGRDVKNRPLFFIVDCHRHRPNWHRGETGNRFVTSLKATVEQSEVANLTVMTSCGPGEQSHVDEAVSQTSFGYYFAKGLSGAADSSTTGNNDNYVSFAELRNFVSQNVGGFAETAFGTSQHVQTFTTTPDDQTTNFVVSWVSTRDPSQARTPVATHTPVDLTRSWTAYERVRAKSPFLKQPIAWGDVESELIRTEMLADGGECYRTPATLASNRILERLQEIEAATAMAEASADERHLQEQLKSLHGIREEEMFSAAVAKIPESPLSRRSVEYQLARLIAAQSGSSIWDRREQVSEAMQTRALAESTAEKMSAEANSWVAPFLFDADVARRLAEDTMFAGEPAVELFRMARDQYENVAERASLVQEAIDTYNRASAEIFWFARWSFERSRFQYENDSINVESVRTLIQETQQLGDALHNSDEQFRRGTVLTFQEAATNVSEALDEIHQQLSREYAELLRDAEPTPEYLHRAQSLLNIAVLPASNTDGETGWKQRERLAQLLREQVERRLENSSLVDATSRKNAASYNPSGGVQLLRSLFSQPDDDGNPGVRLQQIGVRNTINDIRKRADEAFSSTESVVHRYRNGLLMAAGQQRIAAAMATPVGEVDAVAAQQHFDERLRHLNLCERIVDDFYGPAGSDSMPFFSTKANTYLLEFQTSLAESVALQKRLLEVNDLLTVRMNAADDGLSVSAQDVMLMDGMQLKPVDVSISKANDVTADSFPSAIGSLYFATADGEALSDVIDTPLADIFAGNSTAQLSMRPSISGAMSGEVFAVTNVRGNLFKEPVLVTSAGGQETQQEIHHSAEATVSVDGTTAEANSVVIIFDCSQSMSASVPAESPGSQQTRFEAAKAALFALLQKLADKQDTRVGLSFFGHRVGWNPRNREQLLLQDQFLQGIPAGLRPFEDVEMLLPVGRFDAGVLQTIKPLIDSTKPWGETPLYLAITEAVLELQNEDKLRSRRIIVVTDGVNHQVNPTPSRRRTINDVLQTLPEGVRVDIVGFGIPDADTQQARDEFEAVTSQTEGQFIPVDDVTELVQSLNGLVESEDFEVAMPTGEVTVSTPGQKISMRITEPSIHATVTMGSASEEIVITGGDAVQLQLSDDKQRLFVPRWLHGNPQFVSLGTGIPFAKSSIECGIQKVRLVDTEAIFGFSLQHATRQFIPKPASAQISVFPTDPVGNRVGIEYRADVDTFQPGTSVPAFSLKTMGWPVSATHAELTVFVQADEARPVDRIQLDALQPVGLANSTHRDIVGLNGVHAYVMADTKSQNTLTIVEKHDDGSPGLGALVVRLKSVNLPIRRTQRIDQRNGVVATIFEFDSAKSMDLANDVVEFILSNEMQRQSLHMMKPVVLPVSTNSGLLIPTN